MKTGIIIRLILSVIAGYVFSAVNTALYYAAPLVSGEASVGQLENSNAAYMKSNMIMHAMSGHVAIPTLLLVLVWAIIWMKELKGLYKKLKGVEVNETPMQGANKES